MTVHDGLAPATGVGAPTDGSRQGGPPLRVTRADNGFEISLDELVHTGEHPLLWSVNEKLRLVRRPATGRVSIRAAQVVRLSLATGRQLELMPDQRVRKVDGWTPVAQLSVGSRIGVLRRLSEPSELKRMDDSELIMLAHMIGDGSCVKRQPVRYASIDEANLLAVTIAAAHFGVTAIRDEYETARVTTLRLPAPFRLTHGKRNPIAEWLGQAWPVWAAQSREVRASSSIRGSRRASCPILKAPVGY